MYIKFRKGRFSENKHENRKWYLKKYFLHIIFSIHISINTVLDGLKSSMHVGNICVKRKAFQIFVVDLSFYFQGIRNVFRIYVSLSPVNVCLCH